MKNWIKSIVSVVFVFAAIQEGSSQVAKYKCLVQMDGYKGDAAYVVISLVSNNGRYEKTLYVLGNDKKWYKSLKEWYKFYQKQKSSEVSAVTGASISGGDRAMKVIEINESLFNKGYKIRFESAVEDQQYHAKDVEVPLTVQGLAQKTEGTGYIKYIRFSKVR